MIPTGEFGVEIMQYERMLRPFAFNLTKNREETEYLVQDTFFRALSNKEKFEEGTKMLGVFYGLF